MQAMLFVSAVEYGNERGVTPLLKRDQQTRVAIIIPYLTLLPSIMERA
jgi:hypothetical protein